MRNNYVFSLSLLLLGYSASAQTPRPVNLQAATVQLVAGSAPNDVVVLRESGSRPTICVAATGRNELQYCSSNGRAFSPISNIVHSIAQPLSIAPVYLGQGNDLVVLRADGSLVPFVRQRTIGGSILHNMGAAVPFRQGLPSALTDRLQVGRFRYVVSTPYELDIACWSNGPQPGIARASIIATNNNIPPNYISYNLQALTPVPLPGVPDSAQSMRTFTNIWTFLAIAAVPLLNAPAGRFSLYTSVYPLNRVDNWWGFSSGSQPDRIIITSPGGPSVATAVGDVNNDNIPDLVTLTQSANVYVGATRDWIYYNPPAPQVMPILPPALDVQLVDLNRDARPELLILGADNTLSVFENISTGTSRVNPIFASVPYVYPLGADPAIIRIIDGDSDGFPDVFIPCRGDHTVRIFWNNPATISATATANAAEVAVYPNPGTDVLHWRSTIQPDARQLRLLDLSGRVVREWTVGSQTEMRLPVGDVPRGLYLLRWAGMHGQQVRRVVLN